MNAAFLGSTGIFILGHTAAKEICDYLVF